MIFVLRRMYPHECRRYIGQIQFFTNDFRDRIINLFMRRIRKNPCDGMVEPFARNAAAFGIDGE